MWPTIGGTENYKLIKLNTGNIMVFMVIYTFAYTTPKLYTLQYFDLFGYR